MDVNWKNYKGNQRQATNRCWGRGRGHEGTCDMKLCKRHKVLVLTYEHTGNQECSTLRAVSQGERCITYFCPEGRNNVIRSWWSLHYLYHQATPPPSDSSSCQSIGSLPSLPTSSGPLFSLSLLPQLIQRTYLYARCCLYSTRVSV